MSIALICTAIIVCAVVLCKRNHNKIGKAAQNVDSKHDHDPENVIDAIMEMKEKETKRKMILNQTNIQSAGECANTTQNNTHTNTGETWEESNTCSVDCVNNTNGEL